MSVLKYIFNISYNILDPSLPTTTLKKLDKEKTKGWVIIRYYFFKLGRSLLTQRRRQDFPVRCKRPLDRMELQSLGPYFFTCFLNTSSSSAFHGPFFIIESLIEILRYQLSDYLQFKVLIYFSFNSGFLFTY